MQMKKLITVSLVLALAITVKAGITAPAADTDNRGSIAVRDNSSKEYAPNTAQISLYIETSDKDLVKATEENKKKSAAVIAAVKKVIDPKIGDSVRTSSFNVTPNYYYTKDNKRVFEKYIVTNSLLVKTKNTDTLGTIINTGLSNGASRVEGLRFTLEDYQDYCNELISDSTKKVLNQAQTIAKALNMTVDGLKRIDANCSPENAGIQPFYKTMNAPMMADAASGAENIPTEAGMLKLNAYVNAEFFLKK